MSKELGSIKPAGGSEAAAGSTTVDQSTLDQLYKLRDNLNEDIKKSTEKFETTTSKLNFRIDHLKNALVALLDVC